MHLSRYLVSLAALATPLVAQFSDDYEAYTASGSGTIITGQNGYYIPVAGSLDGLVYTYVGNTIGVPTNPNGGSNFYGGISQLTNIFARAQRAVTLPANGLVYVQFDVCCNYLGVGTPANNIGSFSFQPSASANNYLNLLARWPTGTPAPPPTWNADVVAGSGTPGTTVTTVLPDPAFQNLAVNVWHTWGVTVDLNAGTHVDFRITDGVTNVTTVYVPATPLPLPVPAAASGPITDFRFFTGGSENLLATDNLIISYGAGYAPFGSGCAGSMGVPSLSAAPGSLPQLGTTFQADLGNLPQGLAVITSGFSDTLALGSIALPFDLTGTGFPGCFLLVDPLISQFLIGSGGMASWSFPIPLNGDFAGIEIWQQGISLDPVAPGAAFTNGGAMVIGY